MAMMDAEIKKAKEILSYISSDKDVQVLAEAREKAILDEISRINGARKEGERIGEEKGIKVGEEKGINLTKRVFKLFIDGKNIKDIAKSCNITEERVNEILD